MKITFRNANFEDASLLYFWRNSPEARNFSQKSEPITLNEHTEWLSSRLLRISEEPFLIFFWDQNPVGSIRLEFESNKSEKFFISIFVDPAYQGMGIGEKILEITCEKYLSVDEATIIAKVKKSNLVSKKLFIKAGFKFVSNFDEYMIFEKIK